MRPRQRVRQSRRAPPFPFFRCVDAFTARLRSVACMASSSAALNELAQLLLKIVTVLPPETHPLVLQHLPTVELSRLSCVHKALHVAWQSLQE